MEGGGRAHCQWRGYCKGLQSRTGLRGGPALDRRLRGSSLRPDHRGPVEGKSERTFQTGQPARGPKLGTALSASRG